MAALPVSVSSSIQYFVYGLRRQMTLRPVSSGGATRNQASESVKYCHTIQSGTPPLACRNGFVARLAVSERSIDSSNSAAFQRLAGARSEERRVGKECR